MPDYDDTDAYPVYATKQELLRHLMQFAQPNVGVIEDILYRINNTDLTGLGDGATTFTPADTFGS